MVTTSIAIGGTDEADARQGWDETIRNLFGAVDMNIADLSTFSGRVRTSSMGTIDVTRVDSTCEDAQRTGRHISNDTQRAYVLAFVLNGALSVGQMGRSCDAGPGRFVLFDLGTPYRYSHPETTGVLSLKIPSALLEGRLSGVHGYLAKAGHCDQGIGRVTQDTLSALAIEADHIPDLIGEAYAAKLVDLIAILLEAGREDLPLIDSASRWAIYRRILAHIEMNLGDCSLSPRQIADTIGISVRYLHKIFQEHDQSVGEFIRTRRLARCYEDLVQPGPRRLPIKDIALRAGFRSQSHFSTSFRRQYQMSPTDARQALV